jgi:hypothetical protein
MLQFDSFARDHRIIEKKTLTRLVGRQAWTSENVIRTRTRLFGRSSAASEQNRSTNHGYENEWEEAHDG